MFNKFLKRIYISYARRKQQLNKITIVRPTCIHYTATFSFHKKIKIGKFCRIGYQCHIDGEGGVTIGDGTIFAPRVVILSSSHDYQSNVLLPYSEKDKKSPVAIGKGCWIGWGALICPGVTICDGAIVAMGSVVTKDVERGHIVGGNPAKTIRIRDENINIAKLVEDEQFYLKEVLLNDLKRAGRQGDDLIDNIIK
jgi:maltose O-acetyltransferase